MSTGVVMTMGELRGKVARQAMITDPGQLDAVIGIVLDAAVAIRPLHCADENCQHGRCEGIRAYAEALRVLKEGA